MSAKGEYNDAISFKSNVNLSHFTSLGLGGKSSFFFRAASLDSLCRALRKASSKGLSVLILGGGSNLLIPDEGFDGLVIKMELKGLDIHAEQDTVRLSIAGGENWDAFVKKCIALSLGGLECLSGIPGLTGATPIQNVGAYGQEVSELIEGVECLDRKNLALSTLSSSECSFAYRSSIFKRAERDRFIVTRVHYVLKKDYLFEAAYDKLKSYMQSADLEKVQNSSNNKNTQERLQLIRDAVLKLRSSKGMLLDPEDPESRSVGSFFLNPVLTPKRYEQFELRCKEMGISEKIPYYPLGKDSEERKCKVSAAWLIERSGFKRGFRQENGSVGISKKHSLALVNYGGTMKELLSLASQIEAKVEKLYGIRLEREAVLALASER